MNRRCRQPRWSARGNLSPGLRAVAVFLLGWCCFSAYGIGGPQSIETVYTPGSFVIVSNGAACTLLVDDQDWPGVVRVANDLQTDIARVTGVMPRLAHAVGDDVRSPVLILGTIGRSRVLGPLIKTGKLDVSAVVGKWETSLIEVVKDPMPGIKNALVIAGSDKRGTIFGAYELSEQMGVSPWHWWADVPPKHHDELYVSAKSCVQGPPAVKYRGIFINDEGPCLMTWARKRYGELNHGMYTNVFELILRLKGNYLWPAMWDNSFATDDPLSPKLADEYGVVIGTSHHEPMMRAWKEWGRAGDRKGSWDYSKNEAKLRQFWTEGLRRTKDFEKVITIGMRGDGDEPMSETESISLLERIVAEQRKLISEQINPNVADVPQVWALYKEVQRYYERGMRVPDDVTLLWCDDNWGNLRRLPTAEERKRPGGAGIYYHLDYVGGPRNYKWLNTVPLPKIWEQMNLALQYGADRLWIVNVGDIKPEEVPLEFFLAFAWNPARWTQDRLQEYLTLWAEREFGPEHAPDIAEIVAKYAKYNGRRKPELLEPGTFSLENYNEADRIAAEWKQLTEKAERIYGQLRPDLRDAFYELVLYPTKASAVVNELYITAASNRSYADRGDPRANEFAEQARALFREDAELSDYYNHKLANGKWNHMMDQTHIGYTGWQQPDSNTMPALLQVTNVAASRSPEPTKTTAVKWSSQQRKGPQGFIERDGYVAIEAEHYTRNVEAGSARWQLLPDHGRTLSAMTVFPVTTPSVTNLQVSPRLEYDMWLTTTGAVQVALYLSPSLNFDPSRGVNIATSFDEQQPQVLTVVPKGYNAGDGNRDWEESVKDSVRKVRSTHQLTTAGRHTFKVWMVDPGVVLQRIVIDTGGERPSHLGPPESPRRGAESAR